MQVSHIEVLFPMKIVLITIDLIESIKQAFHFLTINIDKTLWYRNYFILEDTFVNASSEHKNKCW